MRPVAVAHVTEQRQSHRQHDALPDAYRDYHRGGARRQLEFAGAFAPHVAQVTQVDEPEGDREDDGAERAPR